MSKKLVTKDEKIIKTVENALGSNVPHVTFKASDGNIVLAVCNKNGGALAKATKDFKGLKGVYIGVLRGHKEYTVPSKLMTDLAKQSEK